MVDGLSVLWDRNCGMRFQFTYEENIDKFKSLVKTLLFDGTEQFKKRAFMYI